LTDWKEERSAEEILEALWSGIYRDIEQTKQCPGAPPFNLQTFKLLRILDENHGTQYHKEYIKQTQGYEDFKRYIEKVTKYKISFTGIMTGGIDKGTQELSYETELTAEEAAATEQRLKNSMHVVPETVEVKEL